MIGFRMHDGSLAMPGGIVAGNSFAGRSLFFRFADLYTFGASKFFRMQNSEMAGLINRVAIGDRQAFTDLYRVTSPKLFGICLRILKDRGEAEEALQEVYIRVWQKAKSFAIGSGVPTTWLATIARNHAIDIIRARKPINVDIDVSAHFPAR